MSVSGAPRRGRRKQRDETSLLAVIQAIRHLTTEHHGQPPSLREIATVVTAQRGKPASTSTVRRHIQELAKLGLATYWPRRARSITLTPKGTEEANEHPASSEE